MIHYLGDRDTTTRRRLGGMLTVGQAHADAMRDLPGREEWATTAMICVSRHVGKAL
ncbi:bacterioferritin [Pandoraea communis]|uniref:Bacterioferritin n=1 Tax=Pandoraea communis TaxID=2508297 RepID=A0A5E4X6U7_9BURK|nr:bacterioferritin [Pandoraea communis]